MSRTFLKSLVARVRSSSFSPLRVNMSDLPKWLQGIPTPRRVPASLQRLQLPLPEPCSTSDSGSELEGGSTETDDAWEIWGTNGTCFHGVHVEYYVRDYPIIPGHGDLDMAPGELCEAKVKSALSGDTLVLTSLHDPKRERIISLAFVDAPRMKRDAEEVRGSID